MHWLCWHASKFVEVGEYLLAGKFGQIFLRDSQCWKMRQLLSDSVPHVNDCEQRFPVFCSTALPRTRQQCFTVVRADTLLDSTVITAFSHDRLKGCGNVAWSCSKFVTWIILQSDWYRQNPAARNPWFDPPPMLPGSLSCSGWEPRNEARVQDHNFIFPILPVRTCTSVP